MTVMLTPISFFVPGAQPVYPGRPCFTAPPEPGHAGCVEVRCHAGCVGARCRRFMVESDVWGRRRAGVSDWAVSFTVRTSALPTRCMRRGVVESDVQGR